MPGDTRSSGGANVKADVKALGLDGFLQNLLAEYYFGHKFRLLFQCQVWEYGDFPVREDEEMPRVVRVFVEDNEGEFAPVDNVVGLVVRIFMDLGERVAVPGFIGRLRVLLGLDVLHTPVGMQMLHKGMQAGNMPETWESWVRWAGETVCKEKGSLRRGVRLRVRFGQRGDLAVVG